MNVVYSELETLAEEVSKITGDKADIGEIKRYLIDPSSTHPNPDAQKLISDTRQGLHARSYPPKKDEEENDKQN